jgi:hypothetical protein
MTRVLSRWRRLLLLLLAILGVGQIGYWAMAAGGVEKSLDPACAAWDREASLGIAALVPDPTPLAQSRLDEALLQLRRARQNCRAGWLDVARAEYQQMRDNYPAPGRALVDAAPDASLGRTGP